MNINKNIQTLMIIYYSKDHCFNWVEITRAKENQSQSDGWKKERKKEWYKERRWIPWAFSPLRWGRGGLRGIRENRRRTRGRSVSPLVPTLWSQTKEKKMAIAMANMATVNQKDSSQKKTLISENTPASFFISSNVPPSDFLYFR